MPTTSSVTVGVLGPVTAWVGGEEITLGPPRQRALLAILGLAGGAVVSRDAIIDRLWGDTPPGSAGHAVQVYVSRLRKILGANAAVTVAPGYRLSDDVGIDASMHEHLVATAREASKAGDHARVIVLLRQAEALWRGEPLAGMGDLPFARIEAPRLRNQKLAASELRLSAELMLGNHVSALPELEELVAATPEQEEPFRLLLLALHRTGRGAEALRRYDAERRRLAEELGVDPSPALQRLHRQLLDRDPALDARIHHAAIARRRRVVSLPTERSAFVGREAEVSAVFEAVREPGLVTLVGPGGVGKTRLALAVARHAVDEARATTRDGVVFVDLSSTSDAADVPAITAMKLGLSVPEKGENWAPYVHALRDRALLFVLDNLEQLPDAGQVVSGLRDAAPNSAILATSRVRLHAAGELVVPVSPLPTEGQGGPAADLFRLRARAADPSAEVNDDAAVAALVAALDGLPLAIELAAGRVGMLPPAELLAQFERLGTSALAGGPVDAPERHRSLEQSLLWSRSLLTDVDRILLDRLSTFAGAFTIEAAEEIAGGAPVDDVLSGLARLHEAHLVERIVAPGPARFRLLVTIREFTEQLLADSPDALTVRERHTAYYLALARRLGPALLEADRRTALAALDHAASDIGLAMDRALPTDGLEAAHAVWRWWKIRGRLTRGRTRLGSLLERLTRADVDNSLARIRGQLTVAHLRYWQGQLADADADYRRLAVAASADGHIDLALEALAGAVMTSGYFGVDPAAVDGLIAEHGRLTVASGAVRDRADHHAFVGFRAMQQNRYEQAEVELTAAHQLATDAGAMWQAAQFDIVLCRIALARGDAAGALRPASRALEFAEEMDDLPVITQALDWCGVALAELDGRIESIELEAAAAALRAAIGGGITLADRNAMTPSERLAGRVDAVSVGAAWRRGSELSHRDAAGVALAAAIEHNLHG